MSIEQKIAQILAESRNAGKQVQALTGNSEGINQLDEATADHRVVMDMHPRDSAMSRSGDKRAGEMRSKIEAEHGSGVVHSITGVGTHTISVKLKRKKDIEPVKATLQKHFKGEIKHMRDDPNDRSHSFVHQDRKGVSEDFEWIDEAINIDDPSDGGEQDPYNKKNNVDQQQVGGRAKASNVVTKGASAPEASHLKASMKEDVEALIGGEELSEEFKQKAATIFEAAVMSRVKQEVARLDEAFEQKLTEQVEQIKEGLVEKVDGYLDYVVEQWMEQNEIALERGMKSEILEGFVAGLKGLFEEHYIELPEEKFDVLGALEEQTSTLEAKLTEQFEANVALRSELAQYQRMQVVDALSEGLAETDKEKLSSLAEELEFSDVESFEKKVQTIRESYFTTKATTKSVVESVVTDTPVTLTEEKVVPAHMRQYLSVLDNLK